MESRGVLRGHHRRRIAGATALVVVVLGAAVQARAQGDALLRREDAASSGTQAASIEPPAPEAAMGAFHRVADYVRGRALPADAGPFVSCPGVAVTIRLDGQVIGRGATMEGALAGAAMPLKPPVAQVPHAAVAAMAEARQRVPLERDALFEESLRALAPRFAVTLELSGALVPLAPREWADVAAEVAPGLEGVAVRLGDRVAAFFPEQMLSAGTDPAAAAGSLVSRLTGEPALALKKPAELTAEHGAVFYRFRTTVIAQARAGGSPMFLHRGGRVVRQGEITEGELRRWAAELADHLIHPVLTRSEAGELHPTRGERADLGVAERGVVALALRKHAAVDPDAASRRGARAGFFIYYLREARVQGEASATDAAISWVLLRDVHLSPVFAHATSPAPTGGELFPEVKAHLDRCAEYLREATDKPEMVPPGERAAVAWALAVKATGDEALRDGTAALIRSLFRETSAGQRVAQMPWLGWAELTLHPEGDVPSAVALREMREMVWKHQLRAEDLPADQQDLAGGIVFTASRQPLPTWHAARPLAFIATMLGDERLTPEAEVPGELSRLLASLRFLRQLTAGEAEGHMYANPAQAMGGVRASVFDQRMPPEATAFTLMAVCETLRSLERIKERQGRAEGEGP